jgi:hypothetical protein
MHRHRRVMLLAFGVIAGAIAYCELVKPLLSPLVTTRRTNSPHRYFS